MEIKKDLYKYLFHYNNYTEKWACYHRDLGNEYFNGEFKSVGFGIDIWEAYKECKKKEKSARG